MRLIDADALMPNAEYKGRYDVVTAYDIANAPTIEPERKKGKWIFATNFPDSKSCYVCKDCGAKLDSMYPNFCPNCGADMRGDSDE